MSTATTAAFERLLRALPTIPQGTELILRPGESTSTATLRCDGAPPRVFATAADMVQELHPNADGALPGAAVLADAEALATLLSAHVGAVTAADVVAWRPGRRAVVRITGADGHVQWLKLLDRKTWRRARTAFVVVRSALAPIRLMTPIALFDDVCGYLAPSAPGVSLRSLLAADAELPWTTIARSVLALGYTQQDGELPTFDFERARASTIAGLRQGEHLRPELADLIDAVAGLTAPEPPTRPGFVHGDLHDKQLFLSEHGTAVIDLEGMARGDVRLDVANLAEHLRLRDLQQLGHDRGLGDQLLARCGHAADDRAVRAFRALVRARLCGVYALRPRWRALVGHLHLETSQLLEGLS